MLEKQTASETVANPSSKEVFNSNICFYRENFPEHAWFLDVNDYSKQLLQIKPDEMAEKQFWILCSLPNNKVLCFYHRNPKDSGVWFSLDTQGNIFRFKKPSHKEVTRPVAVYYKNDMVYVFGFMKWYKLDIYRDIYFTIAGGNNHLYYSCALFYDYIIISSEQNIYLFEVYDILTNSKSTMNTIEIGGVKHLFTLNENLYAVDDHGHLFSLSLWNLDEWKFMGVIKRWGIDRFSYWLYYDNDAYIMTSNHDMIKFEFRHNKIDAEISQTNPNIVRGIHRLDSSVIFDETLKSFLPLWKDLLSPTIIALIKQIWSFIVLQKRNIGIFPSVLNKSPDNERWFDNLEVGERLNYFFEIFKKDPRTIKIIILISMPKKKIIDYNKLIEKINMVRRSIDLNKKWIKLKKDIIVLSPAIAFRSMTREKLDKFNEFVIEIAHILNSILNKAVFMLWGKEARKFSALIDQSKHLVIKNCSLLSTNEGKIKNFEDSKQFQLGYSFLYH
ncbi:unnamed protein product [Blepharisma stoltei]|uniref:Uncharacterized protein n=1 Tax=Blepharisma stoltei TaxID=1481888 RepID=A0AAU9J8N2_9CILI|nr:unnamed protein product [Blepharisma stoltei]